MNESCSGFKGDSDPYTTLTRKPQTSPPTSYSVPHSNSAPDS